MPASDLVYDRRAVLAWSLYDFANSAFTTLVVTFIYATYFTVGIAPNEVEGTSLWSLGVTTTGLVVALLSPYAGAIADRGAYRKRFLLLSTGICVAATAVLFFPTPGQVRFALTTFVVANIAFEMANVFYNAFLPDLAPREKIGRISGYGWALGYVGGLLCMVTALFVFVNPETPPFGLSKETGAHVRATNLLVAVWFALFSLPMFLLVKEKKQPPLPPGTGLIRSANRQLAATFRQIRRFRQVFRLLLARLIYNDGLITIFAFGGIYAAGTFGFTTEEIIVFGIVLNVAAGLGAYAFGFLDDRLGGKTTVMISLAGLAGASLLAVLTTSRLGFWVAGILIGLLAGPNQSASRSLLGRFVPPGLENEFYGFFAFSGKLTAFLGPFLLGRLTDLFESQRLGVASVLLFFILGGILLLRVDEKEGVAVAGRPARTAPLATE
ncbi:MFS transporter [Rhodocaloribacter litoris]|uniref:MFS transporter n=1 Tax=Rhodocaloribacter litoris TaxID=2558931 RepID=UPI00141DE0C3|nr:MFS transporter [Rhodocaloribacter litoris]